MVFFLIDIQRVSFCLGGIGSDETLQAVPTTSTVPTGNGDLPHHAPPLQVSCTFLNITPWVAWSLSLKIYADDMQDNWILAHWKGNTEYLVQLYICDVQKSTLEFMISFQRHDWKFWQSFWVYFVNFAYWEGFSRICKWCMRFRHIVLHCNFMVQLIFVHWTDHIAYSIEMQ